MQAGNKEITQIWFTISFLFSALLLFLGIVLSPCLIRSCSSRSNCGKLVLGLLLSYCSRFCNLIALLWAPKSNNSMETLESLSVWDKITSPEIMWGFIIALFFISSVRVYQGKIFFSLLHMQNLISRCQKLKSGSIFR